MKLVAVRDAARVRADRTCRDAGWPPKPDRVTRRRRPPRPGLRVVSVTEDSVTLAWNASTDNSGSIHAYVVSRAPITRATAR